jgi:hypothetical protein
MEESSQNENIMNSHDEIYLNEVLMEEEIMEKEFGIQPRLQIEESINVDERKEK